MNTLTQQRIAALAFALALAALLLMMVVLAAHGHTDTDSGSTAAQHASEHLAEASTVGGAPVPDGLDCAEDDTIHWIGIDTLGCVHVDTFR